MIAPPKKIWSGQLVDDGPLMEVWQDRWGQHLRQADGNTSGTESKAADVETIDRKNETIDRKNETKPRQRELF